MTPFKPASIKCTFEEYLKSAKEFPVPYTMEQHRQAYKELMEDMVFINDLYQVNIRDYREAGIIHLSVKLRTKQPIHDWRHLQQIKNELVGPEHEAVEIYPAESRLVDTANQYHLWVFADPSFRIPFGFASGRAVTETPGGNAVQRPFNETD
jgi:hypothetical protein